jgi:hypothetical protein
MEWAKEDPEDGGLGATLKHASINRRKDKHSVPVDREQTTRQAMVQI